MMLFSATKKEPPLEMKHGPARPLTPMDLPELLQLIDRELTYRDRVACLLVCKAWRKRFEELTWRNQIYNRPGILGIESKGHLIHSLKTYFPLDDHHLNIIGSHCPNIVKLDLEISTQASPNVVDEFMANLTSVRDLSLRLNSQGRGLLCSLNRMSHLCSLRITGGRLALASKDPLWIITWLHAFPALQSISIDACLTESHFHHPTTPKPPKPPIQGIEYNVAARPLGKGWLQSFFNDAKMPPDVLRYRQELEKARRKEPWRKFVPLHLPPAVGDDSSSTKASPPLPASYRLLDQAPLDDQQPIERLTCLVLSKTATTALPLMAQSFFRLLPGLKEVALDFGGVYGHPSLGLAQMAEHCRELQSVRLQNIYLRPYVPATGPYAQTGATSNARASSMEIDVNHFFSTMPPRIRSLAIVNCSFADVGFLEIPSASLEGLEALELINTGIAQKTLHKLLALCQRLLTLTIGALHHPSSGQHNQSTAGHCTALAMLGQNDHFLGDLPQPWECTWTLRHVNIERWCMVEAKAFDTLLERIETMPCLTWLSLSFAQVRQLVKDDVQHCSENGSRADTASRPARWNFFSLLDLRFFSADSFPPAGHFGTTSALNLPELECLLTYTPKLRRMWYSSSMYPLDKVANTWLQEKRKDLSVQYCSLK